MDNITVKAVIKKAENGVIILPVTQADRTLLDVYTGQTDKKYVTVMLKTTMSNKSYTQLKTCWALISVIYKSMYGVKPTESERNQLHDELLEEYSERKPSILHPGETTPITLREMSSKQLSNFIQILINILAEDCQLENAEQLTVKELFCEWENYLASQKQDWTDYYDDEITPIPIPEWRELHKVSFASGLTATEDMQLDLAHIVSRGADEIHRDCCWNTMMLTHEEHMKQHEIGWDNFLKLYPHLRGRVERARLMAGKLALKESLN